MRNFTTTANGDLADLLERPRFGVLPTAGAPEAVAEHLPPRRSVTVSASPRKGLAATLDTSLEIAGLDDDVVPHLAARMVTDRAHLAEIVARLREAGISHADRFLRSLAPALTRDESVVAGLHVFTFNQIAATEAWRVRLIERLRDKGARTRPTLRGTPRLASCDPPPGSEHTRSTA
jgi:hypothetical protein